MLLVHTIENFLKKIIFENKNLTIKFSVITFEISELLNKTDFQENSFPINMKKQEIMKFFIVAYVHSSLPYILMN